MKASFYLKNALADILYYLAFKIRPLPRIRSVKVEGFDAYRVMTEEEYRMGGPYFPVDAPPK